MSLNKGMAAKTVKQERIIGVNCRTKLNAEVAVEKAMVIFVTRFTWDLLLFKKVESRDLIPDHAFLTISPIQSIKTYYP
jgi:hypothetical protein